MRKLQKGFTLIELLVVIGILAVLTAIVLVAVNPGRQYAQARDTQRRSDVNVISSAAIAYMADPNNTNKGSLPTGLTAVCPATQIIGSGAGNFNLGAVVAPTYVAALPFDPDGGTEADTKYTVCINDATAKRFTVSATGEFSPVISVTR